MPRGARASARRRRSSSAQIRQSRELVGRLLDPLAQHTKDGRARRTTVATVTQPHERPDAREGEAERPGLPDEREVMELALAVQAIPDPDRRATSPIFISRGAPRVSFVMARMLKPPPQERVKPPPL